MRVLAGDIGGTNTRLAVFDVDGTRLETLTQQSYPSGRYSGLENIVRDFFGGSSADCRQACFGIAGPVQRGRVETTNLPWVIEEQALAALFGFERVALINDLEANASKDHRQRPHRAFRSGAVPGGREIMDTRGYAVVMDIARQRFLTYAAEGRKAGNRID